VTARTVVITGATRGVGRGIADAFARRGDALVIVGRSRTPARPPRAARNPRRRRRRAARAGGDVVTINADLARTEVVRPRP
jgi:3-oxoacyl-[acyl-carrier protein] reductase